MSLTKSSPIDHARVMERLEAGGISMAAVGREFGASRERIRQIAKIHGHNAYTLGLKTPDANSLRSRMKRKREVARVYKEQRNEAIMRLHGNGLDQKQIACIIGVTQATVSKTLLKHKIKDLLK